MKLSIKITAKDLFEFSMYNAKRGMTGFLNLLFSVGPLVIFALSIQWTTVFQKALLIGCFLLFAVIQPALLYGKSKRQAERSGFSTPIDLTLTDEEILVEQGRSAGAMPWSEIWGVISLKNLYVLKIGPTRGYLIPKRELAGREKELIHVLKKNLPPRKTKGLKE